MGPSYYTSRVVDKDAWERGMATLEAMNPLRGLTASQAQDRFDAARQGDTTQLQWLYNELEGAVSTLMISVERRSAAVSLFDWHISERAHLRKADGGLMAEQTAALEEAFADIDQTNFADAVEHLAGAFFRGFAHVSPHWAADGLSVTRFDLLKGWNVVRDAINEPHVWRWNPLAKATVDFRSLPAISPHELVSLVRPRHIDYPAMQICLRQALGERSWGRFIDRYGVPPVIVIMPPDTDPTKETEYMKSAEQVADGGSGALPAGSMVHYAGESRGADPFSAFLDRQEKTIVLLATGGMLTSLVEATGLGSGTGEVQQDTWREIVGRDMVFIGAAINRQIAAPILERAFPGRPKLAAFTFDQETAPTAREVFEHAAAARAAGYRIDIGELQEMSGYKLLPEPAAPPAQPFGGGYPVCNSAAGGVEAGSSGGKARENAREGAEGATGGSDGGNAAGGATGSLAASLELDDRVVARLVYNSATPAEAVETVERYLKSRLPGKAALIQQEMARAAAAAGLVEDYADEE